MKKQLRKCVYFILEKLKHSPVLQFIETIPRRREAAIFKYAAKSIEDRLLSNEKLAVCNGPFKGMIYPGLVSVGSQIIPKLVGSYESELHPIIEKVCQTEYSTIIDIGAAEGYYAVGFAMRIPNASVYAYEMNNEGRDLCKEMARINQMDERVHIRGFCDFEELSQFCIVGKTFIICDCEGYEFELLHPARTENIKNCDILVEVHDYSVDGATAFEIISSRFKDTHHIIPVNIRKKKNLEAYSVLKNLKDFEKELILAESRHYSVGWLFMVSKKG